MSAAHASLLLAALAAGACQPDGQDTIFGHLPSVISQSVTEGGPDPADVIVPLTNNGTCQLRWQNSAYTVEGRNWLEANPSTSMLSPHMSGDLTVSFHVVTAGLTPGTYTGNIVLYGTCTATSLPAVGSPVAIAVNLKVTPHVATISVGDDDVGVDLTAVDDEWQPLSPVGTPSPRHLHSAVWTGQNMLVWGGVNAGLTTSSKAGYLYEPLNDVWTPITTSAAPTQRWLHSAVWTGSQMIVWGGRDEGLNGNPPALLGNGGRYTPSTGAWAVLPGAGAPSQRFGHRAVWGDGAMFIWGGQNLGGALGTGARYNLFGDTWFTMPTAGAPSARAYHTMVWTGDRFTGGGASPKLLVWGGTTADLTGAVGDGAAYEDFFATWTPIPTGGAPSPRYRHSAVFTGKFMIIWGGTGSADAGATGGLYDPVANRWLPMSSLNAPSPRYDHLALWTGAEMVVWGGRDSGGPLGDGARYEPETDTWTPLTGVGAPAERADATAVWTGDSMLVWGGQLDATTDLGDGAAYH